MKKPPFHSMICLLAATLLAGCMESLDKQVEKSPNGIIGKKTQEIGKLDKNAQGQRIMPDKPKVEISNPVTGPLEAYGPMIEQISKSQIEHAVRLFEAENARYPKDYEEFMAEIIKKNNIQLPVLPGGLKYMYNVEEHKLAVVKLEK